MIEMAEVSEQLRNDVLEHWEQRKNYYNALTIKPRCDKVKTIEFPILINGVFDSIIYDVGKGRFVQFRVMIASKNITPIEDNSLIKGAAYCGDVEFCTIDIPREDGCIDE